jgi:hypothetical protein
MYICLYVCMYVALMWCVVEGLLRLRPFSKVSDELVKVCVYVNIYIYIYIYMYV